MGPSGAGKSTIVRALAELCGQQLHVLSVNSEMDTIELLGGFEQVRFNVLLNVTFFKSLVLISFLHVLFAVSNYFLN